MSTPLPTVLLAAVWAFAAQGAVLAPRPPSDCDGRAREAHSAVGRVVGDQGQVDRCSGADPHGASQSECAAVGFDQRLGNGQPQASSSSAPRTRRVSYVETIE